MQWDRSEGGIWREWSGWHDDAERSTRIEPPVEFPAALPPRVEAMAERCRPVYQRLHARRLQV